MCACMFVYCVFHIMVCNIVVADNSSLNFDLTLVKYSTSIRQHGSAVYVGMVVVVCIP